MITIEQLLESVDLDFEPRWVTKDEDGEITIYAEKPIPERVENLWNNLTLDYKTFGTIKLAEFSNKDWQECIYEVPRKTTGKIEKLEVGYKNSFKIKDWQDIAQTVENKINELVVAVNELKGAKNE